MKIIEHKLFIIAILCAISFTPACSTFRGSKNVAQPNQLLIDETREEEFVSNTSTTELTPEKRHLTYVVKSGDTLFLVARDTTGSGHNWRKIAQASGISNSDELEVGQQLVIPAELVTTSQSGGYSPVKKLNLYELTRAAIENEPRYLVAIAETDLSAFDVNIVKSEKLPQLSGQYSISMTELSDDNSGSYLDKRSGLSITQSIYSKQLNERIQQAKELNTVANLQLQLEYEDMLFRVARGYFDVLRVKADLDFREADLEATRRQLSEVRALFRAGGFTTNDVLLAKAQYDQAIAAKINAENNLSTSREALNILTGFTGFSELAALRQSFPIISPVPNTVKYWEELARKKNAELRVAQKNTEIAINDINLARTARYPTLSLSGSWTHENTDYKFKPDTESGLVQLDLNIPIYNGGRVTAEIARQRRKAQITSLQERTLERQLLQTTREIFRRTNSGITRIAAFEQALLSTTEAEAAAAGLNSGTKTLAEYLQARRDTYTARSDYTNALYDHIIEMIKLRKVTGSIDIQSIESFSKWLE